MNRMGKYVYRWCTQGKASVDLLAKIITFIYTVQDRSDGLWGAQHVPANCRINGTFKIFELIQKILDLPLPRAERIVDKVLEEFYRPDYDERVGACDEWDNWVVLEQAFVKSDGHRRREVERTAARRILRVLKMFRQSDAGFSYWPDRCGGGFLGIDLAPQIAQGEAHAAALLAPSINICIDILGIRDQVSWQHMPVLGIVERDPQLRQEIIDRVFPIL